MKPFEIMRRDQPERALGVWGCGKCGRLYGPPYHDENAEREAFLCCQRASFCRLCEEQLPPGVRGRGEWMRETCPPCTEKVRAERDAKREAGLAKAYAAATKVRAEDYPHDYVSAPEGDELTVVDDFEWDPDQPWAFGAKFQPLKLDVDVMLEHELQDHHEDAGEPEAVEELRAYVAAWNEQQTAGTWWEDRSVVVLFDVPEEE